jgi:hypothetical protein
MEIESGDCKHVMDDRDLKRERRGSVETEVSQHIVKIIRISSTQFLNLYQFFFELKTNIELLKEQKNTCSKKTFNNDQLFVLEEWFELNKHFPYANNSFKHELAKKANLTLKKVQNWLDHKRAKTRKKRSLTSCRFTLKNRIILSESFKNNKNPSINEVNHLSELTGLSERQIKCWFTKKKFIEKQQKN